MGARAHLILAEGEGLAAVIDLLERADTAFAQRATLLYTNAEPARLPQLPAAQATYFPDAAALLREGAQRMERARMGTAIYIGGSARFIGDAASLASVYGVSFASLRTERRGDAAKSVQCVHCKAVQSEVLTPTVKCTRCGLKLLVRDHYSHRLKAYMGVACETEQAP